MDTNVGLRFANTTYDCFDEQAAREAVFLMFYGSGADQTSASSYEFDSGLTEWAAPSG